MDLKGAVAVAKQEIGGSFAVGAPRNVRLEGFLYDDHLMIWSLTIGFDLSASHDRTYKVVRVSESEKTVLSIRDP
jgi:hypothetical protein